MIIRKVRLFNIKCFGEGDTGNGVEFAFEPGLNRIAGSNGKGKSSLIEAIGLALFDADPMAGRRFSLDRYLLRHGTRRGEIDVWVEFDGDLYCVQKGYGPDNKRRPKVLRCSDSFVEAEGELELRHFLASAMGISDPARLAEVFQKLVGVRQGFLPYPWELSSSLAKKYFDPLLDLGIYQQCFDELKAVLDLVREEELLQSSKIGKCKGKIEAFSEAPETLKKIKKELEILDSEYKVKAKTLEDKQQLFKEQEKQKKEQDLAQKNAREIGHQYTLLQERLKREKESLKEASEALDKRKKLEKPFNVYQESELALKACDKEREEFFIDETKLKSEEDALRRIQNNCEVALQKRKFFLERQDQVKKQINDLQSGICPLFKERCRQYDIKKLSVAQEENAAKMTRELEELAVSVQEKDAVLIALSKEKETKNLFLEKERKVLSEKKSELDKKRASLNALIEKNHESYLLYQRQTLLAEKVEEREKACLLLTELLEKQEKKCLQAEQFIKDLESNYDENRFIKLKEELLDLSGSCRVLENQLLQLRKSLKEEELKAEELKHLRSVLLALEVEQKKQEDAVEKLNLVRRVLRKAAPAVAEQICKGIAEEARKIYVRLGREPVGLDWDSSDYQVALETTLGRRVFHMLSGGEKTKLGLAMVLAMVQSFSSCGLLICDEPTYGVDAESKEDLADAILRVAELSELDQVFIVSHEAVFDDRMEHSLSL